MLYCWRRAGNAPTVSFHRYSLPGVTPSTMQPPGNRMKEGFNAAIASTRSRRSLPNRHLGSPLPQYSASISVTQSKSQTTGSPSRRIRSMRSLPYSVPRPCREGGQQMPVVRFPTDRGLRITRRHRGGRCRRITPERRGIRERQPVPIHHRHADIAVAGDGAQDHRELIPMPLYDRHRAGMGVRAAAVVPQVLHPGGRRFDAMPAVHGQARIPAVRVHRGRRTISGYGASVLVGPLRAATDGRHPLELPEPQRIGLGAPPLRTLHAQAVVVEVHAVETVVVHHIGVQAAVGPQIDVLEEHPVQADRLPHASARPPSPSPYSHYPSGHPRPPRRTASDTIRRIGAHAPAGYVDPDGGHRRTPRIHPMFIRGSTRCPRRLTRGRYAGPVRRTAAA